MPSIPRKTSVPPAIAALDRRKGGITGAWKSARACVRGHAPAGEAATAPTPPSCAARGRGWTTHDGWWFGRRTSNHDMCSAEVERAVARLRLPRFALAQLGKAWVSIHRMSLIRILHLRGEDM